MAVPREKDIFDACGDVYLLLRRSTESLGLHEAMSRASLTEYAIHLKKQRSQPAVMSS